MLNGIRLNNFDNGLPQLNDLLGSTFIQRYEEYITMQLELIFGNDITINNTPLTIKNIKYKNILEKINIILRRQDEITYSYLVYDLNNFQKIADANLSIEEKQSKLIDELSNQNKTTCNILSYYMTVLGELNSPKNEKINQTHYKRNFIGEFDVKILNTDNIGGNILVDFWEYIIKLRNKISNELDYESICNLYVAECIKGIKAALIRMRNSQIQQYWILFNNPDNKIDKENTYENITQKDFIINLYKTILHNISVYQLHFLKTSTGLIGPNTQSYSLEDNYFLLNIYDDIINNNVFDLLCFTNHNIDIKLVNVYYDGDIILTDMTVDKNNIYDFFNTTFNYYKQNIYCIQNKLFSFVGKNTNNNYIEDNDGVIVWLPGNEYVVNINPNSTDINAILLYETLSDIYNPLIKFNTVTNDNIVGEGAFNQLSLYDDDNTDLAYILYQENGHITIAPHYARHYYNNNTLVDILNPLDIDLGSTQGVAIVIEDNTLDKSNLTALYNKIKITLEYYQETIKHLIDVLPQSYNKEIDDTNFFKLLRSLASEMSEDKYNLEEVKNGLYLNDFDLYHNTYQEGQYLRQVNGDLIYNNFGSLIDLPQKSRWTTEKYREIVTAIINILLSGPTLKNMQDAILKFTGYKNDIFELYKERNNYLFADLQTWNLTFKFAIILTKDLNKYDDSQELYQDLLYVLHIIKPAQALFILYILFEDTELVDTLGTINDIWTGKSNHLDDIPEVLGQWNHRETTYGYKFNENIPVFNKEGFSLISEEHNIFIDKDFNAYYHSEDTYTQIKTFYDDNKDLYVKIPQLENGILKRDTYNNIMYTNETILIPDYINMSMNELKLDWRNTLKQDNNNNYIVDYPHQKRIYKAEYWLKDIIDCKAQFNFDDYYTTFKKVYFKTTGRINLALNRLDPDGYLEGRLQETNLVRYNRFNNQTINGLTLNNARDRYENIKGITLNGTTNNAQINIATVNLKANQQYKLISNNDKARMCITDNNNFITQPIYNSVDSRISNFTVQETGTYNVTICPVDVSFNNEEIMPKVVRNFKYINAKIQDSDNVFILYGNGLGEGERLESVIEIENKQYSNTPNDNEINKMSNLDKLLNTKKNYGNLKITDTINIDCDKTTISRGENAQFTSNFYHVKWVCNNGIIDDNGLYTAYGVGKDIIKCTSILDDQTITKEIIVTDNTPTTNWFHIENNTLMGLTAKVAGVNDSIDGTVDNVNLTFDNNYGFNQTDLIIPPNLRIIPGWFAYYYIDGESEPKFLADYANSVKIKTIYFSDGCTFDTQDSGIVSMLSSVTSVRLPNDFTGETNYPSNIKNAGAWFPVCTNIKEVTIPDSVTVIGYHAFLICDSLDTLKIIHTTPNRKIYVCDDAMWMRGAIDNHGLSGLSIYFSCSKEEADNLFEFQSEGRYSSVWYIITNAQKFYNCDINND